LSFLKVHDFIYLYTEQIETIIHMKNKLLQIIIYSSLLYFFYLLLKITFQYIPFNTDVAFLRIKQQYLKVPFYKEAFFVHVYTAIFSVLAGFTQFSNYIKTKYLSFHKKLGWLYVLVVLFLAAPSGLYIGLYANGGISSRFSFVLLAILWFSFTLIALLKIFQKKYFEHKTFMIRSFALTLSAITLRAWKVIIVYFFHPRPMDVYLIIAWLAWTLNLLIAEIIIYKLKKNK